MGKYKLINNVLGWVVFLIASTVYLMTMEPTASFWDCGEFISSAYKLEVGHPPGAPFFMLTANLFTQFASDPSKVAVMVNTMSALFSGLTILFLFWSITHLARKIIVEDDKTMSLGQMITIMGCGLVGSLAYTFSDTFWFSAVEGEVYAYSSLFTALVFWLILKWEEAADRPHADRWIVLIAYFDNEKGQFKNRTRVAAGAEFIPRYDNRNYLGRIRYRAGFHYSNSYLRVSRSEENGYKGHGYNEYGASIGFGLPLIDNRSLVNLSFEYVKIRPELRTMIDEQYFRFTVNYTFNELWFFKRKVD